MLRFRKGYSIVIMTAVLGLVSASVRADEGASYSDSPFSFLTSDGTSHAALSHIPRAVGQMTDVGAVSADRTIPVLFALRLNNESELATRIAEMYRPGSPTYHQFITPNEYRARYAATQAQIDREKAWLEAEGISIQSMSDNHVFLHGQATVGTLNKVFNTELHQYVGQDGKLYFSPAREVQIPEGSQITAVIGLHNLAHQQSHVRRRLGDEANAKKKTAPSEGGAPGGGLAPADVTKAYGIPGTATGAGQTLALFELDAYDPADIQAYESQFNLPNVPLQNVYVDGSDGQSPGAGQIEVTLDVEMMVALAPKATKILVYEGSNAVNNNFDMQTFETDYLDVITKIANDNLAPQISSSWGLSEDQFATADIQAENTVFQQMVAQGQSFFEAAGDSGSEDDGSTISIDNPAGQPNTIAVGGTTLTIDSATGARTTETTWNDLDAGNGAGGGGISTVWSMPTYQKGAPTADKEASATMRNVPDVSLNADPDTGYGIYESNQGGWVVVGGTSAAAPLWAAFNALVNQQRAASKLSNTGFLNPALYAIGTGSNHAQGFYDIVTGTNGNSGSPYSTYAGYDNASGWGAFQGSGLLDMLAKD